MLEDISGENKSRPVSQRYSAPRPLNPLKQQSLENALAYFLNPEPAIEDVQHFINKWTTYFLESLPRLLVTLAGQDKAGWTSMPPTAAELQKRAGQLLAPIIPVLEKIFVEAATKQQHEMKEKCAVAAACKLLSFVATVALSDLGLEQHISTRPNLLGALVACAPISPEKIVHTVETLCMLPRASVLMTAGGTSPARDGTTGEAQGSMLSRLCEQLVAARCNRSFPPDAFEITATRLAHALSATEWYTACSWFAKLVLRLVESEHGSATSKRLALRAAHVLQVMVRHLQGTMFLIADDSFGSDVDPGTDRGDAASSGRSFAENGAFHFVEVRSIHGGEDDPVLGMDMLHALFGTPG
jgi:hypothetical protein